jgi:hypothetical protein
MNLDLYDANLKSLAKKDPKFEPDHEEHEDETDETDHSHCTFGSALPGRIPSHQLADNFDARLRKFLREEFGIAISDQEYIQVLPFLIPFV